LPSSIDLSVSSIFLQATSAVQAVLILLALASVVCWAIIVEKAVLVFSLRRQLRILERVAHLERAVHTDIRSARPQKHAGLARTILDEGRDEWAIEKPGESVSNRRDRAERAMRDVMVSELIGAESRLHYLATIGSSAPFVGLFGTVWGIMHAFTSIAQANDTSLATVAPGIAEALSTTAIGLVAAIPASVAYNKLASDFGTLARRLALAIGKLARRLDEVSERKAAE
jgi:biopolymer transport protein TolQ